MSSDREILVAAARAVGRVAQFGPRPISSWRLAEVHAMALALVILGLVAIPPGHPVPEILTREGNL